MVEHFCSIVSDATSGGGRFSYSCFANGCGRARMLLETSRLVAKYDNTFLVFLLGCVCCRFWSWCQIIRKCENEKKRKVINQVKHMKLKWSTLGFKLLTTANSPKTVYEPFLTEF
jgi:hypothetical protein